MSSVVLSLGSNLGERTEHLQQAVHDLGPAVRAVSGIYRTPPWGGVDQDDFYNIIVLAEDDEVDAHGWLDRCRSLEQAAGRQRTQRWGPRTLDADVIVVQVRGHAVVSDDPELTLPHPRTAERAFVLVPWAEVDPTAELPGAGPISDLLETVDTDGITRIGHVHRGPVSVKSIFEKAGSDKALSESASENSAAEQPVAEQAAAEKRAGGVPDG